MLNVTKTFLWKVKKIQIIPNCLKWVKNWSKTIFCKQIWEIWRKNGSKGKKIKLFQTGWNGETICRKSFSDCLKKLAKMNKFVPNWPKLRKNCLKLLIFFPQKNCDEKMFVKKTQTCSQLKLANWGLKKYIKSKKSKLVQIGRKGETVGQKSLLIF